MDYPASTPVIVVVGIMGVWLLLSLFMGGKKAYFETWDKVPEDENKHA